MRNLILCSLLSVSVLAQTSQTAPSANDSWERLHLLIGTWKAQTSAQGTAAAQALGTYTFQYDLNRNVIMRTSSTDTCKGPATYDCQHRDTLILYRNTGDATHMPSTQTAKGTLFTTTSPHPTKIRSSCSPIPPAPASDWSTILKTTS